MVRCLPGRIATVFALVLTSGVGAALLIRSSNAQQQPPFSLRHNPEVRLELANAKLSDVLLALNTESGVQSIADGEPSFVAPTIRLSGRFERVLNIICETYDVDSAISKGGIVQFTRRFNSKDELPQLHPRELGAVADDILRLLPEGEADAKHEKWGLMLQDLITSFSELQRHALYSGEKLKYSDLSLVQQRLFTRAIQTRAFGPIRGIWEEIRFQLKHIEQSSAVAVNSETMEVVGKEYIGVRHLVHRTEDKRRRRYDSVLGSLRE